MTGCNTDHQGEHQANTEGPKRCVCGEVEKGGHEESPSNLDEELVCSTWPSGIQVDVAPHDVIDVRSANWAATPSNASRSRRSRHAEADKQTHRQ